jgi:RNA polymerase sigma factor (sigma-70 family)
MSFGPVNGQSQPGIDFSTYLDGLYGYAVVLSRNSAEAEDLVQEACRRALRSIGQLRPDGNVKSWLFTILRNIWLNQVRHRRTVPEMAELDSDGSAAIEPVDGGKDPHEVYISVIEREQVREAIHNCQSNSARSSSCENTKSFPIKRLRSFSIVRPVPSCRVCQGRGQNCGTCFPTNSKQ